MSHLRLLAGLFFFAAAFVAKLSAHELQPGYLELRQTDPETFDVLWKSSARADLRGQMMPQLPSGAEILAPPVTIFAGAAVMERSTVKFPGGLDGQSIAITGPLAALADVLVQVVRPDGQTQYYHLNPASPSAIIEAAPSRWSEAVTFIRLGIEHILMGVDHLLFVLGLLLIVPNRWMLVKTITAFTVAHSITLALATLGYASAPLPPLNAAIALSILFLGPEIIRRERGQTSLTIRHPWVVAFAFGLLHGFGFASGLTALGLARSEIPWALVSFNVGVELGQLFFVFLILLLERSFRILETHWSRAAQALPAYTVGGLGAYWTIQRTVVMFHSLTGR